MRALCIRRGEEKGIEMIYPLKYGNTNTYLIRGNDGWLLFDTDWAGTFPLFCRAIKERGVDLSLIRYVFISHFHPDHMGLAGEIAGYGPKVVVFDVQREHVHGSDGVFTKENRRDYQPIKDQDALFLELSESRNFLKNFGIEGEVLATPGHSDDSISLWLDEGIVLVGDLNPLYELELHKDSQIGASWEKILSKKPKTVYYGHAAPAVLSDESAESETGSKEVYALVKKIMTYIERGLPAEKIAAKTKESPQFVEDVTRMVLTHPGIGVQGVLDRIEIKNR